MSFPFTILARRVGETEATAWAMKLLPWGGAGCADARVKAGVRTGPEAEGPALGKPTRGMEGTGRGGAGGGGIAPTVAGMMEPGYNPPDSKDLIL